ncbi:MarR family winged helix-turn-helix transcriptional regulator [Desulfoluna limicola]|nr:MarR family transcriptional regulator [Desulfoluna limicola]
MFFLKELPSREMLKGYKERFPQMDVDDVGEGLRLLRRASLLLRRIEAYFATHKLSQTRFLVLIVLDREGLHGGLLAKEIAEKLDISRPIVTNTLKSMKDDGLLHINPHAEDGRAKWITLTGTGREKLSAVLPEYYAIIHDFMNTDKDEG